MQIADDDGKTIDAIIPVRLDVMDPHGRRVEASDYYGAKDGRLRITADLAPNDVPGLWRIKAQELGSGKTSREYFRMASE